MSGILALLRTDGAEVDDGLLERLTGELADRGPDGRRTVALGSVGLGHALLVTSARTARERQPCAVGGELWISADARLDGRADLLGALEPLVRCDLSAATDPELVLHAYRIWGDLCVERLLGDFAFVIWDAARRRLFCARDPFGVKLLYFARVGRTLVVSNTLACVRRHPDVSDRLDDRSVGSLLLWGEHDDRVATTFADVRAVPAAHLLSWSADRPEPALRRYWELPHETAPVAVSDRRDVVDEFRTLLDAAVADRLPDRSALVFMSGGVDSTMVAAAAKRRLAASGGSLTALTVVFDRLLPDRERHFSSLAARALDIPIHHFGADHLYTSWDWMRASRSPEPHIGASNAPSEGAYREAAARGRVILTGWDGDSLLALSLGSLWRARMSRWELGILGRELAWHARQGRLPRIGLRAALARWRARGSGSAGQGYPTWLRAAFERTQELPLRWLEQQSTSSENRSPRAPAYRALGSTVWRTLLDPMDAGMTGMPLEHRHPLLDLRLVRFALALPPVPWCVDKHLFRETMRNELPRAVVGRAKEPLPGDPIGAGLAAMRGEPGPGVVCAELAAYVDPGRYRAALRTAPAPSGPLAFSAFNTAVLDGWLAASVRGARPEPRRLEALCS